MQIEHELSNELSQREKLTKKYQQFTKTPIDLISNNIARGITKLNDGHEKNRTLIKLNQFS